MSPDSTSSALRSAPFTLARVGRSAETSTQGEHDSARAAGYAAGFAAGAREAARVAVEKAEHVESLRLDAEARRQREHAAAIAMLVRAAEAAAARTVPVLAHAERTLHGAALELASALLGHELSDAATSGRAALSRVLATPSEVGVHTVRLNPGDLAALLADGPVAVTGVELVADPALAPGDAVGEHPDGYLDAKLTTALARAHVALGLDRPAGDPGAPGELPSQRGSVL